MKFEGKCIIEVNVFEIKVFDRRSGQKGQEVVIQTDSGYRCNVDAVDVSICDFSGVSGIHKFLIEPMTAYDKFVSSNNKQYGRNYATFKIIGLVE